MHVFLIIYFFENIPPMHGFEYVLTSSLLGCVVCIRACGVIGDFIYSCFLTGSHEVQRTVYDLKSIYLLCFTGSEWELKTESVQKFVLELRYSTMWGENMYESLCIVKWIKTNILSAIFCQLLKLWERVTLMKRQLEHFSFEGEEDYARNNSS